MQPMYFLAALVLIFLPSQSECQAWNYGRMNTAFSRNWGRQRFSNYGFPQPEPEPEPEPFLQRRTMNPALGRRITRRLIDKSGDLFQSLSASTQKPLVLTTRRTFSRFSQFSPKTTKPAILKIQNVITTQATTRRTTTKLDMTTTTTTTTTQRPTTVTTLTTSSTSSPRYSLDSLFNDFNDIDSNEWAVRPGQFEVLAAVPSQPVKENNIKSRLPKSAPRQVSSSFGKGIQFKAVPAVPGKSDTLTDLIVDTIFQTGGTNSREIEEKFRGNIVDEKPIKKIKLEVRDNDSKSRKQFKRCQGKCVQQFCLPVENIKVYEECVEKCKDLCEQ